jgi:hypothetical protein
MNRLNGKKIPFALAVLLLSATIGFAVLVGCAGSVNQASKPGAQLWGENCGRCHNIRSITSLDDDHWEVAVQHMRTRAGLTGDEANKIAEFLKASN